MTLEQVDRGWWRNDGYATTLNHNTLLGWTGTSEYNIYFRFDLSGQSGHVVSALLRLELENYYSPDPSETLSVWDVQTDPVTLDMNGTSGDPASIAVFTDLQTGSQYGGFTVASGSVGTIYELLLNAAALDDLNNALGGAFAVGVHEESTPRGGTNETLRFSSGDEYRVHQLVLGIVR